MCYTYVFGPSKVMTPFRHDNITNHGDHLLQPGATAVGTKPRIDTALLLTCKSIYTEALDLLYGVRIVRGNITQFWTLVSWFTFRTHVRRVEIDDWINGYRHPAFIQTLLQLRKLPRIRSVIILSDCLTLNHDSPNSLFTVFRMAISSGFGVPTCVDIGRYQLCGKLNRIQIVNRRLVEMWPSVVSTPDGYDAATDVLSLIEASPLRLKLSDVPLWAAQTSFRRWVGLYDEITRLYSGTSTLTRDKRRKELLLLARFHTSVISSSPRNRNGNLPNWRQWSLRELRPGDYPWKLEWATEFLALNIAIYRSEQSRSGHSCYPIAHWAEADGGMHTFDIMGQHVASVLNGGEHARYMLHPVFKHVLTESHFFRLRLGDWYPAGLLPNYPDKLPLDVLKPLYLLHTALQNDWSEAADQQSVNKWSSQLLRRYLSATDLLVEDELAPATVQSMRLAMRCVFEIIWHSQQPGHVAEVCDRWWRIDDPTGLDEELVEEIAWDYNQLFLYTWRIVVRDDLRESMGIMPAYHHIVEVFKRILRLEDDDDE